jgi:hypothetical protein
MGKHQVVGTLAAQAYKELDQKLKAGPEKYTKRIRIYVDVDGVIMPIIRTQKDLDQCGGKSPIKTLSFPPQYYEGDRVNIIQDGIFAYKKRVAEQLSEWSHRDYVDLVWLTSWRINAPYALDELLNIKSVGYLPWAKHRGDYNHSFKGLAIEEDQKASPSKFIWLDDFANKRRDARIPFFTHGHYGSRWVEDPNSEIDSFTGIRDGHHEELGFVTKEVFIDPERYLTITTKGTLGLSKQQVATIDDWLLFN